MNVFSLSPLSLSLLSSCAELELELERRDKSRGNPLKMRCRSRARVVFPLDDGPEIPTMRAFSGSVSSAEVISVRFGGDLSRGVRRGRDSWWGCADRAIVIGVVFILSGILRSAKHSAKTMYESSCVERALVW
jgi:hypothetical protein